MITLLNFCECHPCYLLEAPGGAKRSSASSSRCRASSRRISSSRAWLDTRQSGWLAALARSAWASVCSSRPIRFGVHPRPRHPVPVCPRSSGTRLRVARRASQCCPGPSAAEVRAGSCVAELAGAPVGRAMGVCSTGCAWRVVRRHTPRPRASTRGRAERHRSGACPSRPVILGLAHPQVGRGRSMARALNLVRANAAPDRSAEIPSVGGSSSGHNG
jgi:hypothetical protein